MGTLYTTPLTPSFPCPLYFGVALLYTFLYHPLFILYIFLVLIKRNKISGVYVCQKDVSWTRRVLYYLQTRDGTEDGSLPLK